MEGFQNGPVKELLLNKGWFYTSGCNCGGVRREEYQHSDRPGVIVKIWPKKMKYKVSKGGKRLSEGGPTELQNYLDGLVQ